MKKKTAFVLAPYTLTDPTTRNTVYSIHDLFEKVIIIQQGHNSKCTPLNLANTEVKEVFDFGSLPVLFGIRSVIKWIYYRCAVHSLMRKYKPDCVITFQLGPLAAINLKPVQKLISCVYDIPDPDHSGKLDTVINKQGFKQLKNASLVWASDEHKSKLTQELGRLSKFPLICYNCPRLNYINEESGGKAWLRGELRKSGAVISNDTGTVMIRAGAIGPNGGIEETLKAMNELPDDNLFLMMGRPANSYSENLQALIKEYKLEKRAFFWDRPDDKIWKRALLGADIGHLVHLRPPDHSPEAGLYEYNSSLSNYRLFYYMAAGLPIFSYNDPRLNQMHNEGNCFIVLKVENLVSEVINNWKLLSQDNALRKDMGEIGQKLFRTKFNWENQFKEIRRFIEML